VNDLGYALLYPVGLALYSRAAPRSIAGLMIGVFYLHLFLSNMLVGRLGGYLETLGGTSFWLLHSGLVAVGCGILLFFTLAFRHLLAPTGKTAPG
jgi:POT family proton-dependent oligopeptide transporter